MNKLKDRYFAAYNGSFSDKYKFTETFDNFMNFISMLNENDKSDMKFNMAFNFDYKNNQVVLSAYNVRK